MKPESIRNANLAFLNEHGFFPATWLPLPAAVGETHADGFAGGTIREPVEIAKRLLCHAAVFAWGSAPSAFEQTIARFIATNQLDLSFTSDEAKIVGLTKESAVDTHAHTVGWRLENMWSLAWILGLVPEPSAISGQITADVSGVLMQLFLPDFAASVASLIDHGRLQSPSEVIRVHDLFYLAHNAVRGGQLGESQQIPKNFDPIQDGGAIHERRHSLTWALSPGVAWDDTDLST